MGYLKTIFEGEKTTLYLKEIKKFKEAKKAKTSLTASFPPKLVDFKEFYFSNLGVTPNKLKLKYKEHISITPLAFQPQMKAYIKEKNLKVKNHNNLIIFFKFYELLLEQNI